MKKPIVRRPSRPPRSPGERAFDLCFIPYMVSGVIMVVLGAARGSFPGWLPGLAMLMLALWYIWALMAVIRAWRDPFAKVLRFVSLALIIAAEIGLSASLLSRLPPPLL